MELKKLCDNVCSLAKQVGAFIREEQKTFTTSSVEKKGHNDLVSYVDKTAEKKLVAELSVLVPEAGFITEEKTVEQHLSETPGSPSLRWIIDPLDGTTNFIHGVPCYCISIALSQDDEIILGVVYE